MEGERISDGKKTLSDIKTVVELEAFLTRPEFRQDPYKYEDRDFSEFWAILEDEGIAAEAWIRYSYEEMNGKGFDLNPLREDVKIARDWEVLLDYEAFYARVAVDPKALKILLFLFEPPPYGHIPDDLWIIKLEILPSRADFRRRLESILGDCGTWASEEGHKAVLDEIDKSIDKYELWEK
ncbi:MAG: hypothetical protein ACFFFG_10065 [Candidatus Thorarchaeota archaeon]